MKFYMISVILNIAVLFVPVIAPVLKETDKNIDKNLIMVNLSESVMEIDGKSEKKKTDKNEEFERIKQEKTKKTQTSEPIKKKDNMEKETEKPIKRSEKTENIINKSSTESLVMENNISNKNEGPVRESRKKDYAGETSGNISNIGKTGNENINANSRNTENSSRSNVCREGTDFDVVYNPNLQYPIAAERMGIKNTVIVNVKLNFNSNGSVSVISVSGGSGLFQSEAKKAANGIKEKVKNLETLKCTITKPFRFNPR